MQSLWLAFLSCILTALGQVAFKYGMDHMSTDRSVNTVAMLVSVLCSPVIVLGFISFGVGAVIWLFVLARLELSYAVPLSALTYVLVLIAGVLLFKEPLSVAKILGTLLVMAGVGVIASQT